MNLYSQISKVWQEQNEQWEAAQRERLIKWRTEPVTVRVDGPTRLDRARSLGYKAKPGVVVVRQRVNRGGRQRPRINKARKMRQTKILSKNYQQVAEERAARRFPNLEVLNSYFVGKDGKHYWHEVIMVDKQHPAILADKNLSWAASPANRRKAFRGLTSAAKRRRGLFHKGVGTEKIRPSLRAHDRTK